MYNYSVLNNFPIINCSFFTFILLNRFCYQIIFKISSYSNQIIIVCESCVYWNNFIDLTKFIVFRLNGIYAWVCSRQNIKTIKNRLYLAVSS